MQDRPLVSQDNFSLTDKEREEAMQKELHEQLKKADKNLIHDLNSTNKSLFGLTWPIFIDLMLYFGTLIINMMMVGAVSVDSVAELTVGNQVFDLAFIIFNFVNLGVCVCCAQALGAGNKKFVRRLIHTGYGINLILGLVVALGIYFSASFIVDIMQVPEEIAESSENYLSILALCFFPQAICLVSAAILRAFQCTRDAMFISLLINVITILGNSMFLFGYFGMPVIGIEGVAISTVAGRTIACFVFIPLILKRTKVKLIPKFFFVFKKKILLAIFSIGLPGAGENLSWHGQYMFLTSVIASMGAISLATHGIYFQIVITIQMFTISLAMGTEILVAHHAGSLNFTLAYRQLVRSVKIGLVAIVLLTCMMPFGLGELVIGFFTDNKEVLLMATPLFTLTVLQEPGRLLNIVIINSLRATGDTKFPLIMAIISMWGISVPLGCFLGLYLDWGLLGVWIGFTVDEWFRGICMIFRWRSCAWEKSATKLYYKNYQQMPDKSDVFEDSVVGAK